MTDLEAYEIDQTAAAQLSTGALDRKQVDEIGDYEFVFDESARIAFEMEIGDRIGGTLGSSKDAELQRQIEEAERRG